MKPILKSIAWSFLFIITLAVVNGCAKDDIKPTPAEQTLPESEPCDTCATYRVTFSIQNPDHTFSVFVDNVEVIPFSDNFEACTGQVIRLTMTQDCVANGGQCSQWQAEVMRNGVNLHNITGEGSYLSHLYTIP